jgi:hypothetical protein
VEVLLEEELLEEESLEEEDDTVTVMVVWEELAELVESAELVGSAELVELVD